MTVQLRPTGDQLSIEWPLLPRVRPHLRALLAACVWPAIGFPLASALRLDDATQAFALGVGPTFLVLVLSARPLAAALGRKRIVLTRLGGGIAVAAHPPVGPDSFTVKVEERSSWLRRPGHRVRLLASMPVRGATVQLQLLDEVMGAPAEAEAVARALRDFIWGAVAPGR